MSLLLRFLVFLVTHQPLRCPACPQEVIVVVLVAAGETPRHQPYGITKSHAPAMHLGAVGSKPFFFFVCVCVVFFFLCVCVFLVFLLVVCSGFLVVMSGVSFFFCGF